MVFLLTAALLPAASAQAADDVTLHDLYTQAIVNPFRTNEDWQADPARHPMAFLEFAAVRPGMTVLDVAAGGGYTTQLLALVVGSHGTVWAQADRLRSGFLKRMDAHPQANVIAAELPYENPVPPGVKDLDLVTIVMSYHDIAFMPVDRAIMDRNLFDALKTGGHLVVIDHAAKSGSGTTAAKSLHRIDEKVVLEEFQSAGFKLEAESADLHNPDDSRELPFFKMHIPTDKFALRFVKP